MKATRYLVGATIAAVCAIFTAQTVHAQATVQLSGTVAQDALKLPTYGDLASGQTLPLQIWFKPRNEAKLKALLAGQQNPNSPDYHHWLTPQEYAKRFGVSQEEFDKVAHWLTSQGFQVTGGSPSTGYIQFTGNAASISRAFNTRIMKFSADGKRFGNLSEPQIPAEYGDLVGGIGGLNNLHASKAMSGSMSRPATPAMPGPQSSVDRSVLSGGKPLSSASDPMVLAMANAAPDVTLGGNTALSPNDFYNFYDEAPLKTAGNTGTGCIAIVGDSDFRTAPIQSFNSQFGLPDNSASIGKVLTDGSSPGINGDEVETLLDLEWSHAVAPGATIKYFLGNNSTAVNGAIVDSIQAAVNDGTCGVISVSFSLCGGSSAFFTQTLGNIVTQAQAQGQTILVASGDDGAAGTVFANGTCATGTSPNVNELASNPLITSVGGTSFDTGAFTSHTAERAWNDTDDPVAKHIANGGATGGGASVFFPKPAFQNGVTPNDSARDQPDVALIASPNYPGSFFYNDNNGNPLLDIIGGTSIATPMWAGIADLLIQKSGANVGSLNATVYKIAGAGQSGAGFFDVTIGDNNFNGVTGFSAGTGYDQVTGWGTVDINNFIAAYTSGGGGGATPTPTATGTPTPTPTATPTPTPVPATVKVAPGALNFGKVKVGRAKAKTATLTNTAIKKSGTVVTFSGGSISGSAEFAGATSCTGAVPPKGKCKVTIVFAPTSPGAATATVTINGNATNSPQTIPVSGTGK